MKNKLVLIVLFVFGILLFKIGFKLIEQIPQTKSQEILESEFWSSDIKLKSDGTSLNVTPNFFFLTIPTLVEYPADKIIYFNFLDSSFRGDTTIITGTIIQNRKVIYKNSYYFKNNNGAALYKIITEDLVTSSVNIIDEEFELISIMSTYKTFIDLWVLYDAK
ncbi:MAG: hypothetical protein OCD02_06000 [Spirochaetaceae bacterium]